MSTVDILQWIAIGDLLLAVLYLAHAIDLLKRGGD